MAASSRTRSRSRNPQRSNAQRQSAPIRPARRPAPPIPLEGTPRPPASLIAFALAPVVLIVVGIALALAITPALAVLAVVGIIVVVANLTLGRASHLIEQIGGSDTDATRDPRLFNVLEGLCVENGIAVPRVRVLDDHAANALLVPGDDGGLVLVCTRGLLEGLDRIQLEGVLADTLAGAKRGDVKRAALISYALGGLSVLSSASATLAWRFTDPARQFGADREACRMTCFPPGLLSALEELSTRSTTPAGLAPAFARLSSPNWVVPLEIGKPRTPRAGELDLELRISALAEL